MQLQVVSTTTSLESKDNNKQPSARLQEKIRTCVSMFRSLNETVNEVIALGQKEGFTPKEIGHFIRQEMIKSGLSRRTVTRYLPSELKAQPRGLSKQIRDKMSQNQGQGQGQIQTSQLTTSSTVRDKMSQNQMALDSLKAQLTGDIYDIDVEAFSTAAKHLKTETLGKVIDHLAQVYNERTGQKIKVIFRKMIEDDGSSSNDTNTAVTTTSKDKKYQPTPDEVKQRENKVLSVVKEGTTRVYDGTHT